MPRYKRDLINYIAENMEAIAESHLECWEDRYKKHSCEDLRRDLEFNHDDSLEKESAEDQLKRKLTDDENDYLISRFHKECLRIFRDEYNRR